MLEHNPDTVKIVFKHFPLSFHKQAQPAARAAIAAFNQGKFWKYHDLLYKNYNNLTPAKMQQFAAKLSLDLKQFTKELNAVETTQRIQKDVAIGRKAGVSGTPAIYVNGHRVQSKDRNMANIQKLIDAELTKK